MRKRSTGDSITQSGFTLIEGLVVVAIFGFMLAIAIPMMVRMFVSYQTQTAAETLSINLRFARNAAVKQKIRFRAVIRDQSSGVSPNTYVIEYDPQKDGSYETYDRADVGLPKGLKILSGAPTSIIFDAHGAADITGGNVIGLQGPDGSRYNVTVRTTGAVVRAHVSS